MVPPLSQRGTNLLKPSVSYFTAVIQAAKDTYHPQQNPEGFIPLAVAQNTLMIPLFLSKMKQVETSIDYPDAVMLYGRGQGSYSLVNSLTRLMQRTFLQGCQLDVDSITCSAGITGILDNLFFLLGDAGQGVLIPAPYYAGFDADIGAKNHLVPVSFQMDINKDGSLKQGSVSTISAGNDNINSEGYLHKQLDAAADKAAAAGHPLCALLVTNPNNPLGIVYSENVIRAMMMWCLCNKVHFVCDEVYALSIYKRNETDHKFVSCLNISAALVEQGVASQQDVDNYVTFVYGISKDFGGAGLSLGLMYSKNSTLNKALGRICYFNHVSNHTQLVLSHVFNDDQWVDDYIFRNTALLRESYDTLAAALRTAGITFQAASAGVFVWLDLHEYLHEQSWEAEWELFEAMSYKAKVVVTPGKACHAEKPGRFRLCFARVAKEALPVAVERIKQLLDEEFCSVDVP